MKADKCMFILEQQHIKYIVFIYFDEIITEGDCKPSYIARLINYLFQLLTKCTHSIMVSLDQSGSGKSKHYFRLKTASSAKAKSERSMSRSVCTKNNQTSEDQVCSQVQGAPPILQFIPLPCSTISACTNLFSMCIAQGDTDLQEYHW